MSNGTSEKSRANPKIVTLCNVPGKREWLVNEMEKIGRVYLFFKYYVFKFSNILKVRNVLWMPELCCSEKQPFSFILENNCLRGLLRYAFLLAFWSAGSLFHDQSKSSYQRCCMQLGLATLLKKRLWHRWCFPVNSEQFLRTPFFQNTSGWLPLSVSFPCWRRKPYILALLCNIFSVLLILECVLSKLVTLIASIFQFLMRKFWRP